MFKEKNRKHLLTCGLIILLSVIIYFNSFTVPFQFDDYANINEYKWLQIEKLTWANLKRTIVSDTGAYNPRWVVFFTFALNYYFGKYNVFGYHLVNLVVHIIAGIALYFFLYLTLNLVSLNYQVTKSPGHPVTTPHSPITNYQLPITITALLISLLWLTNPVQTQAVTYIVQRMASMATMFYLLSLVFYIKGRIVFSPKGFLTPALSLPSTQPSPSRGEGIRMRGLFYFFLSLLFALLSFGSKPISITLPLVVVFYEVLFFDTLKWHRLKKGLIYLFPVAILFLFLVFKEMAGRGMFAPGTLDLLRGFQIFPVIIHFLTLLLFPLPGRLTLEYDFVSFPTLKIILSTSVVIGIVFIAFFLIIRRKPLIPFFIFWFFLNFLPQSLYSAIAKWDLAFEHWLYLSSIGFSAVLVFALYKIVAMGFIPLEEKTRKRIFLSFIISLVGLNSFWTIKRNYIWKDPVSLWMDAVMKAPNNPRAHTNLGVAFLLKGELDQAISALQNALKLSWHGGRTVSAKTHYGLGMAYQEKGWNKEAIEQLEIALEKENERDILPSNAWFHLTELYVQEKRYEEAIKTYKKIIKSEARNETAYLHLANCYQLIGLNKEAIETYTKLIQINPNCYEAYYNLGLLYLNQGKKEEAMAEFQKAAKTNPSISRME